MLKLDDNVDIKHWLVGGDAPKISFAITLVERWRGTSAILCRDRIRQIIESDGKNASEEEEKEVCNFVLHFMALQCGATITVLGTNLEKVKEYIPPEVIMCVCMCVCVYVCVCVCVRVCM